MTSMEATSVGISFALTEEQKALRELAHEFAEKEIRPRAAEYDEHQTHPADVLAKAHEVGLMNLHIPEAYGGPELGHLPPPRPRREEAALSPAARRGAAPLLVRPDRAERGLGRVRDPDDG